jgi:nucleotidyltransferase substrate binding protein (TIGR01987 family)
LETFFLPPALNERERQGLIKAFEYCFELGWNTLRDLLLAEGNADLIDSRDTLRLAFRVGLMDEGEAWLLMVQDRNLTSHTDNRATAEQLSREVEEHYLPCFRELRRTLNQRLARTASEAADG